MKKPAKDTTYASYLRLPEILSAQRPLTAAHDEMLFIAVHQTYEIWFRQMLFELDRVQRLFAPRAVADADMRVIAAGLERTHGILQHLVRQVDILETMTPLDFLDFRHVFRSASGFQSMQFRELEIRLGLRAEDRLSYAGVSYVSFMSAAEKKAVKALEKKPSLFAQLDRWLARTPFVDMGGFDFWNSYRKAVDAMIASDKKAAKGDTAALGKIAMTEKSFAALFEGKGEGWRLSQKAIHAGLFINLYRDRPVLQLPFRILHAVMDLDETMTVWRYRHALMAQRMLGAKMGTGGSSGHDYLTQTAERHRVFRDLFALSAFLIPRSQLPELPAGIERKMGFSYAA